LIFVSGGSTIAFGNRMKNRSLTFKIIFPLVITTAIITYLSFIFIAERYNINDFRELAAILFGQGLFITGLTYFLVHRYMLKNL
jgi:hypothetical protein